MSFQKTGSLPLFLSVSGDVWNPNPAAIASDFVVKTAFKNNPAGVLKAGEKATLLIDLEVKKEAEYVMLEVPIPASCTYVEEANARYYYNYYKEQFRQKTNFYFNNLKADKYHFEIELAPTFSGTYSLNPAKAELMYFPLFMGREALKKVVVK